MTIIKIFSISVSLKAPKIAHVEPSLKIIKKKKKGKITFDSSYTIAVVIDNNNIL